MSITKKETNLFDKLSKIQKETGKNLGTLALLLDYSESMADICERSGRSKMWHLKNVTRDITFSHKLPMLYVLFNMEATAVTFEQVLSARPDGGTALYNALDSLLDKTRTQAILVTDGCCSDPDRTLDSARRLIDRVVVHCVAIGDDADEELLREIARLTGGTFKQEGDPLQFESVMKQLASKAVAALTEGIGGKV